MKTPNTQKQQQQLIDALVSHDRDEIDDDDDTTSEKLIRNETKERIEQSLLEFQVELDRYISNNPDHGKYYLMAVSINPSWSLYDTTFRFQFIRTDDYNVALAAKRYVTYWKNRYDLYGPDMAFHRTKQCNMSSMDIASIQAGYCQSVKGHSRILYVDPAGTPKPKYDIDSVVRGFQYCVDAKLRYTNSDQIIQKKGIVTIVDFRHVRWFDHKLMNRMSSTTNDGFPSFTAMTIIINAPAILLSFVSLVKLFLKPKANNRFHVFHHYQPKFTKLTGIANYEELYESLHHKEWLHVLSLIENAEETESVATQIKQRNTKTINVPQVNNMSSSSCGGGDTLVAM